jgi:mono/diheme cytochrome c family protein
MPPRSGAVSAAGALAVENPEPTAQERFFTPMWLIGLFGLFMYWGTMYVDTNGGGFSPLVFSQGEMLADVEARVPRSEADALVAQGRKVYNTYCTACHQPNGRGLPGQFPPLAGSDWVLTEGPNRMIRIVLNGLQGPIVVNGAEYNNVMLPWRDQLTDQDIAAVITFVRGNKEWGNNAGPASPAQVKAIRDATADRGTYWSPSELLGIPVKD